MACTAVPTAAVGDSVAEDDVLFEVSTDKVDSEVPSPVAGVLTEILVPEGDTVDVGTRLAVIASDARLKLLYLPGVEDADVEIVWDPPWHQSMITAEGRKILGLD